VWAQSQYGGLGFSNNRGGSWSGATGGISGADRFNWNSVIIQDPLSADTRYFATNRLYRSTSPTQWTVISPDLTGGPHLSNPGQVDGIITTAGVSPLDRNVIWTGSDDGRVFVTTNGGGSWTNVSAQLPVRWITSVRGDPFDRETAYVTVSGFRWGEPLPHVFRTEDLGATWTPIAGNLPEAPTNEILADPDRPARLFVATDVGVYETTNGGESWRTLGAGLPNVVVTSLSLNGNEELFAGTYGRSVHSINIAIAPCPWDLNADGEVGLADLLSLLAAWGPNPGDPADFDSDGEVGLSDLLALLARWGACPQS
jgi:hypothetical protein